MPVPWSMPISLIDEIDADAKDRTGGVSSHMAEYWIRLGKKCEAENAEKGEAT